MIRSASDRTECAGSNATSALRHLSHHRHLLSCAALTPRSSFPPTRWRSLTEFRRQSAARAAPPRHASNFTAPARRPLSNSRIEGVSAPETRLERLLCGCRRDHLPPCRSSLPRFADWAALTRSLEGASPDGQQDTVCKTASRDVPCFYVLAVPSRPASSFLRCSNRNQS
jgi:hypothetical protein